MVSFNTRVQYVNNNQIIGAEITVYNEDNDKIGEISVADANKLNELSQALDVIDETYFTQDRLLDLLANRDEELLINATRLNGFQSDAFAKTNHGHSIGDISNLQSSLNNKSNSIHRHNITDINGLYTYELACDKYNVDIGETVTITGSIKDARGDAISGESVEIIVDNGTVLTCNTNASGVFSTTHSFNSFGLHTLFVENQCVHVNVESRLKEKIVITNKCAVYYNPLLKMCQVIVNGQFSISATGSLGTNVLSDFKPITTIPMSVFTTGLNISISDSTGNIHYVNNSGTNGSKTVVAVATYFYK